MYLKLINFENAIELFLTVIVKNNNLIPKHPTYLFIWMGSKENGKYFQHL